VAEKIKSTGKAAEKISSGGKMAETAIKIRKMMVNYLVFSSII